jgi:hypothetical protein
MKASIDSEDPHSRQRSASCSSNSSKRRNQSLRKLLNEVKESQLNVHDLNNLKSEPINNLPQNQTNSHTDFAELQRRLNDLESRMQKQPLLSLPAQHQQTNNQTIDVEVA